MTQHAGPDVLVALDFETAGYGANSACALGMARIEGRSVAATFYSRIRPPSPRVRFTEIHGLTWAMLKDAPSFAELWPDAAAFLRGAQALVAHNAAFDRRVLHASCLAAGLAWPQAPFLCTLKGARRGLSLPSRRLDAVCAHFGIPLRHHHAGSDAEACARIYLALREGGMTAAQMLLK